MKSHLLYVLLTFISVSLYAQDGTLDPSFGDNGSVTIPYFENNAQLLTILKIDDDLFAGGYMREAKEDFTVIKMDLDGNLDASFGENGTLRFVIGQGFGRCSKLLQHPDGGLMAIGWDRNVNKDEYILIKMDVDGNLDSGFGVDGIASGNWDSSTYAESEIADANFLSDGRLIAAGRSYNGGNTDFVVACYDASGSPCANFGNDGVIVQLFNDTDGWEFAEEVVVDADDNIYVSGENSDDDNIVVKYSADGNLVNSFGTDGILEFTSSTNETTSIGDLAIDNNNRLIVSGNASSGSTYGFISRYDSNGNRDLSYGSQGEVLLSSIISFRVKDVKVIDDNQLLVAGNNSGFGTKKVITKLNESGNIVNNFGSNGVTTIQLSPAFTGAEEIAIDSESIYLGGYSYVDDYFVFAVSKLSNQSVNVTDVFNDALDLNIYPNPVADQLQLDSADGMDDLVIYDSTGKAIYRVDWSATKYRHSIATNVWNSGIYNIIVTSGSKVKSMSFIKN